MRLNAIVAVLHRVVCAEQPYRRVRRIRHVALALEIRVANRQLAANARDEIREIRAMLRSFGEREVLVVDRLPVVAVHLRRRRRTDAACAMSRERSPPTPLSDRRASRAHPRSARRRPALGGSLGAHDAPVIVRACRRASSSCPRTQRTPRCRRRTCATACRRGGTARGDMPRHPVATGTASR